MIEKDYLVIGAGPAGIQLGYYLQKSNRDYLILEKGESPGEFFKKFPRHRKLISINKVYTGDLSDSVSMRWDWNSLITDEREVMFNDFDKKYFPDADSLTSYLSAFCKNYKIKISYDVNVTDITKNESGKFIVTDSSGQQYICEKLIVATGYTRENFPDFDGSEYVVPYSNMSVNPEDYTNKRVMIIGKGNSAFETADHLINHACNIHVISPDPIQFAWETHYVGHLRAVNNNLLDTYQLKSQNSIQNANIEKITKTDDGFDVLLNYTKTDNERRVVKVDSIISCIGFKYSDSIFSDTTKPNSVYNDKFPELTPEWESVNIKDLYFAGTLMHGLDYKKSFSGFIHGFRYNIAALNKMLSTKYHELKWPLVKFKGDVTKHVDTILNELVETETLFQQPGFMVNVIRPMSDSCIYYKDVPIHYVDYRLIPNGTYFIFSLENSMIKTSRPFDTNDHPNKNILFLHPVCKCFENGKLINEISLNQDLEHQWGTNENKKMLFNWLRKSSKQLEVGDM